MRLVPLCLLASCTGVYSDPTAIAPQPTSGDPGPAPDGKIVFTTHDLYQGGFLGGLDAADAICTHDATAAGLDGAFKAWLSDVDISAESRLTHATIPYVLVDGTRVADDWRDLIHADLAHAIDQDEHGQPLQRPAQPYDNSAFVWTHTMFSGETNPLPPGNRRDDCSSWTDLSGVGLVGEWPETGAAWSTPYGVGLGIACTTKAHLYCVEQ